MLYISHTQQDSAFVHQLVADLGLHPVEHIHQADVVLFVWSPSAAESHKVLGDLAFAHESDQDQLAVYAAYADNQWDTVIDLSSPQLYEANFPLLKATLEGRPIPRPLTYDTRAINPAQLQRYVQVLAVIPAPFTDATGMGEPLLIRNPHQIWHELTAAIETVQHIPIALQRLMPPTLEHLKGAAGSHSVVHIIGVCQGDTLYLEDAWGHEVAVKAQQLVEVFEQSQTQVLVLTGDLSDASIAYLLEQTPLSAVVTVAHSYLFTREFYANLVYGVREAFNAATQALGYSVGRLTFKAGLDNLDVTMPAEGQRAQQALIDNGLPPMRNVPLHSGFIGQRASLDELSREIASTEFRQIALYGPSGIGKSWLAAEYAWRFAWRYPDGVLWMRMSRHTKSEDVIGQLLSLLEMPSDTNWATLLDILQSRRVLVVLDQADAWGDPLEAGELSDFIARLNQDSGTRFLVTAWGPVQPLTFTSGTEENVIQPLAPDEAKRLILQLIEQRQLGAEFHAMDTFLTETLSAPWLIQAGVDMVQTQGFALALQELDELTNEVGDAYEHYLSIQYERLSAEALALLRRLTALPDGFSRDVVFGIGGDVGHLRTLVRVGLVRHDGSLYYLPDYVLTLIWDTHPLTQAELDELDTRLMKLETETA